MPIAETIMFSTNTSKTFNKISGDQSKLGIPNLAQMFLMKCY